VHEQLLQALGLPGQSAFAASQDVGK